VIIFFLINNSHLSASFSFLDIYQFFLYITIFRLKRSIYRSYTRLYYWLRHLLLKQKLFIIKMWWRQFALKMN